jgi:PilZ domain-containing protein
MSNKPSWNDIPSLKLSLEDSDEAEKGSENRSAVRISSQDVLKMMTDDARVIYVQVVTRRGLLKQKGILHDINQNGLCFIMPTHGLQKDDPIRIGTMLGERPFQTNAIIRWVSNDQVGIEFVNSNPKDVEFLSELYSAKILNRI